MYSERVLGLFGSDIAKVSRDHLKSQAQNNWKIDLP